MEKPRYDADATRKIKKLTLPDGFRVGISNLDNILKEVADLKLTDTNTIKTELLERVKTCNYVASSAEYEYSTALYREYQRKFEPGAVKDGDKTEIHKHTSG
ncbi:hypothetical protein ACFLYR_04495 [Chloroflexota bacterium]